MDCRGIFWELPTTRTSKPREPDSSVFLCCLISCIFARGGCNAETGINLGCGCCWRWGWGVKFRCTKVFKATKKWFGMDGGVLQDSTCFDSHGFGGENNWIDTWVLSQPNHVWVRGALCVRREVLRCHPKLRRSPVIPSPTDSWVCALWVGFSLWDTKPIVAGKRPGKKFQFWPIWFTGSIQTQHCRSCWGKWLALFIS